MQEQIKNHTKYYFSSVINSYSQIFFSDNRWFGILLLLASFIDPYTGVSGLLAVIITALFTKWFGFNNEQMRSGAYGFNSLLVGLLLGVHFKLNLPFFLILVLVSLLTLLATVSIASLTWKNKIPFLSLPFLIVAWIILLSARNYSALGLSERGIFTINELASLGGAGLVNFYQQINSFPIPLFLEVYLKSLGAIFFQYNILAGLLIATGLLICSRIAFSLSLIGFLTGYFFFYYVQGNVTEMQYSFIGFNFILSAIALGGFFLIPSAKSYLLVILITPLIGIFISAFSNFFNIYQLPIFTLPFNCIVMLMLLVLNLRSETKKLDLVLLQQFSPEKNLYKHHNRLERFKNDTYFHIHFPFFGEWFVSQGHEGKQTHKADWRYAWDFVVTDEMKKTFRIPGTAVTDFYCYNLPILAPAAGYIINIIDEVEDNAVGKVDTEHNWGNTIVIKHSEYLYSKISHIKKHTFMLPVGSYVKKGDVIAYCGNSGRSPEPHIHFQLQATPFVGSQTLKYPIAYYVRHQYGRYFFHSFDYPEENQAVSKIFTTKMLREAFYFIPGVKLNFNVTTSPLSPLPGERGDSRQAGGVRWEVFVDAYNQSYIYCHTTKSSAYFVNNETLHYFTDFIGDKKSLLYYFYLGAHKILLGYYQDMELTDHLPIVNFYSGFSKVIQDFIAPFYIYLNADYKMKFTKIDDLMHPTQIEISSEAISKVGRMEKRKTEFILTVKDNKLSSFTVTEGDIIITAECIG